MLLQKHIRSHARVYLVLLIALAACLNIWNGEGIVHTRAGGDSPFLLIRTYELAQNVRAGIFPARWMPDAAAGLGYPFFNFYASLPYYVAAVFNVAGFDLITAIKLTQTLGMVAAALGMFGFARTRLSPNGALLAAAAYTLAPFHLVNIYVRGDSLSEFWAFVWYPLILWRISEVRSGSLLRMFSSCAVLVLALAGLVLTHNVSALLFAPFIVIWSVWVVARRPVYALPLGLAAGLAAALSAWFWLPALGETGTVQLNQQTTGYFNYANHFRLWNLVQTTFFFDYAVDRDLGVFAMSGVQTALTLAGVVFAVRKKKGLVLACFALATFLLTPASAWVWGNAPLFALAQFPWRVFSVQALFAALLIGELSEWRPTKLPVHMATYICAACVVLLFITALFRLPNEHLNVREADVNAQTVQFYEWFGGNVGTTIRAEYLPKNVLPTPRIGWDLLGQPRHALVINGDAAAVESELVRATPNQQTWRFNVKQEFATVALPMLASAGWQISAPYDLPTNAPLRMGANAGSGWRLLELFGGTHEITLTYVGTPLQHWGTRVSLVAWAFFLIGCTVLFVRAKRTTQRRTLLFVVLVPLLLGLAGSVAHALQPASTPSLQAVDVQQRLFPHRGPLVFQSEATPQQHYVLLGATVTPTQLVAGQPFTLALQWQNNHAPDQIWLTQEFPNASAYVRENGLFQFQRLVSSGDARLSVHRSITEALRGPTLLKLSLGKNADAQMIVGPTLIETPPNAPENYKAKFRNGFVLSDASLLQTNAQQLCIRPFWYKTPEAANQADAVQISARVFGDDGREIADADWQPLAGLAPSWSWQNNVVVQDSVCNVQIKKPFKQGEIFTVQFVLYIALSQQEIDRATLRGAYPNDDKNNAFVVLQP